MARALAFLLAAVLAGCLEVPNGDPSRDDGAPDRRTMFLAADMTLAEDAPAECAVKLGGFYRKWAAGDDYATWAAPAGARDVLVESLFVTLRLRATGPVVESVRFPDVMVYAGPLAQDGVGSFMGYGETRDETLLVPGQVLEHEFEIALPPGGLWVPADERLAVKVVPVMLQEDAADIEVLVGPAGSAATWIERALGGAPRPDATGTDGGELVGSAYAGGAAPDSTSRRTPVTIADGAALVVWMNVTAHDGIPDVDLSLEDADGAVLAFSGTPTPRESLKLAPANLRPGEYALVVTSYGSARASYEIAWATG